MRSSLCRGCGQKIVWIETWKGKDMPCDPEQVVYWENRAGKSVVVTRSGEIVRADLSGPEDAAGGVGYISHFATCQAAGRFRRR